MKNWQTIILAAVAIGFAAYAGYLHVENGKLKAELAADAEAELAAAEEVEAVVPAESSETDEAESGDGAASPQVVQASPVEEDNRAGREERRREMMSRFLNRFTDPDLRMDMVEQAMIGIDSRYADFFKKLDLSPEEMEAVKTLMAEREVMRREGQMKAMMASTDEERAALREELRAERDLLASDISDILGEEQSMDMRNYTAALPFKGSVDEFSRSLSYTKNPLSEGQTEALLNAYAQTSREFEYTNDIEKMNRWEKRNLTEEQMSDYYAEKAEFDMMVLMGAQAELNEAQVDSLAQKLLADREREQRQASFFKENVGDREGDDRGGRGGRGGGGGGGRGGRPGGL